MTRRSLTADEACRAAALYASGRSLAEIALALRVGYTPVRSALLRCGTVLRRPGRPRKERAS